MIADASGALRLPIPHLTWSMVGRALAAGASWGVILTTGFAAHAWSTSGIVCLDHVLVTGLISVTAGTLTIGPFAAFGRRT